MLFVLDSLYLYQDSFTAVLLLGKPESHHAIGPFACVGSASQSSYNHSKCEPAQIFLEQQRAAQRARSLSVHH